MKRRLLPCISMLLAAILLLSTGAFATASDEGMEIPRTWARGALEFAVNNGILYGREAGELCPEEPATRAELAAMLCRLFETERCELPAQYTDCLRGAWYYHPMAAAVEYGFLAPTSDSTLSPEAPLTKEEAFATLARVFCIDAADRSVLNQFSDRSEIGDEAASLLAAMVKLGVLNGTDGALCPQAPVSRQELAQGIFRMTGEILKDSAEANPEYENLLLCTDTPLAKGTVIHGNLLLNCNAPERVDLSGVTIEGKLIVCGKTEIIGGKAAEADLLSDCSLSTQVKTLRLSRDKITVSFDGSAEKTELFARHAALSGSGNAGAVTNCGVGSEVSCQKNSYTEKIDAGLDGITPVQENTPSVSRRSRIAEFAVHFENIDTEHVYGVGKAGRECTLNWYVNGNLVKTVSPFWLKKGASVSAALEIPFEKDEAQTPSATLELRYRDQTLRLPLCLDVDNSGAAAYYEALEIPTSLVLATMLYSCTAANGTELAAGDTVYFMGGSDYVQIPGGRFTFVPAGSFEIIDDVYYDSSVQYSEAVAEAFVNEVHDYSSQTDYLIWCNLYSQHVYVFSGTQGAWSVQIHGQCASGKNYSPTRPGVYKIYSKEPKWDFDGYIVEKPCAFDADVAFHSVTKFYGGGILDDTLGTPVSHGCVRLPDEVIGYIYENCPIDTTVVVW